MSRVTASNWDSRFLLRSYNASPRRNKQNPSHSTVMCSPGSKLLDFRIPTLPVEGSSEVEPLSKVGEDTVFLNMIAGNHGPRPVVRVKLKRSNTTCLHACTSSIC